MTPAIELAIAAGTFITLGYGLRRWLPRGMRSDSSNERLRAELDQDGPEDSGADILTVGNDESPELTVQRLPVEYRGRERFDIALPEQTSRALGSILEQAPRLLSAAASLSDSTTLLLRFSPAVPRALATGEASLVRSAAVGGAKHAIARGSNGRFIEHGKLVTKLNPAAVGAAVFQVAAILTAQKFLADIDRRLEGIENNVRSIRQFLENQVDGQLVADVVSIRNRMEALKRGELTAVERQGLAIHLDSVEREAGRVAHHMLRQLASAGIPQDTNWSEVWSSDTRLAAADTKLSEFNAASSRLLVAVRLRALVLSFRGALGLSASYSQQALLSLQEELKTHAVISTEFQDSFASAIPSLRATFQFSSTDKAKQDKLRARLSTVMVPGAAANSDCAAQVTSLLDQVADAHLMLANGVEVAVTLAPSGEVLRAQRLAA